MTIRYGNSIKRPDEQIEYTPEMISKLNDCQDDIWNFLEHIKIIHPDRGIIQFEPYDFQKKILKNLQNNRFNVILASRQSGKCLSYYTTISVRNKKTGEIKDVFIGDLFKENHK
jgi:hypothetical protein